MVCILHSEHGCHNLFFCSAPAHPGKLPGDLQSNDGFRIAVAGHNDDAGSGKLSGYMPVRFCIIDAGHGSAYHDYIWLVVATQADERFAGAGGCRYEYVFSGF